MATKKSAKKKAARKRAAQRAVAGQKAAPQARKRRARRSKRNNALPVGSVGIASRSSNIMRPMRSMTARDGHMCRFKGTDFLTSITIGGSNAAAGDVLYTTVVNPAQLGVARLVTVAKLWERYKFRSLKFRYEPVCPTTTAGQLLGYVDYDTYDDPTGISGAQNLQRAAAHYGEKPVRVWDKTFWEIKDVDPLTDLYVDSDGTDPRWTNQGRVVVLAASTIASTTACGNIYLDYDVEFYIPQLEQTPTTGYGAKLSGTTSCTTSAILGTTISGASWSNIPWSMTGNVLSLKAGSYLVSAMIHGTTISAFTQVTTGTSVLNTTGSPITGAANAGVIFLHVTSTADFTITYTAAAASLDYGYIYVALLPSNAVTVTQRRLNQMSRMLALTSEVESLRQAYNQMAGIQETDAEGKECKIPAPGATASMSALASGSMGAAKSKIPLTADDGYFLVKRGCASQ